MTSAIVVDEHQLHDILYLACQKSVYAYNEQIVNGYLTIEQGVRIGVCGMLVHCKGVVTAIKDVCSLVVRIPYEVKHACDKIMRLIAPPYNTLIISPPLAGKTTLVRDIARWLGEHSYNCLIVDERCEIASVTNGVSQYLLPNCDVLSGFDKSYAFDIGIRSLAPDCIVCDELQAHELPRVKQCIGCGVTLYATMHAGCVETALSRVANYYCFDRLVLLDRTHHLGEIVAVFDGQGKLLSTYNDH